MSPSAIFIIAHICRFSSSLRSASLKARLKASRLAVRGDSSWPVVDTCNTGILAIPGLTAYSGEGKPGGDLGGVFIQEGCFLGGGVRGEAAAGTDGAGLGVALGRALGGVEGARGAGEGDTLSPLSWAAILFPAMHSVSKFLARSNTTFALIGKDPEETPLWMHCTVTAILPRIRILNPA